jgi:CubicO group peptidase (beta-lactamase class C family)
MRLKISIALASSLLIATAHAQQLPADMQAKIASIAQDTLQKTGVPSASIAVAEGDHIIYAQAFGWADVAAHKRAAADMAYPIGSISKQFTAQAVLLLQQRGKLSIDDPVAKYFPNFTRANEVTLRNLMTMTSGYEDFAPQDYIIPEWRNNVDPLANATKWATKPLDFDPGTDWQYSNTNYVILGLIVEKVTGEPLMKFMRENVLDALHLQGVFNSYTDRAKLQVLGYVSHAMAPVRVQPMEGNGWYFGDGDLAMPASTLAQWDLDVVHQRLLAPESYKQFETSFVLKNGKPANYGLGTFVRTANGHAMLEHSGEVGGYVAENMVFPNDLGGLAIVVLTNEVASDAASEIGRAVALELVPTLKPAAAALSDDPMAAKLKTLLTELAHGTIDRSALTSDTSDYFSAETLADFKSTLAPLGELKSVTRSYSHLRGGMTGSGYKATFANGTVLDVSTYVTSDGKLEQLLITGKE